MKAGPTAVGPGFVLRLLWLPQGPCGAFAFIADQSAWLRVHHPKEFFLGLLNAGHVGGYPPRVLLNEARRQGCTILPPDVNLSRDIYIMEGGAIRLPMVVIRGMGPAGVTKVLEARQRGGLFLDVFDLLQRARLNRARLEALRQAGDLAALRRHAA